jgi:hypothetical protein
MKEAKTMANPLANGHIPQSGNGSFNNILEFIERGGSPDQAVQMLMSRDPRMKRAITQMQTMANGGSAKDLVMQLAQRHGIDMNRLQGLARKLGAR